MKLDNFWLQILIIFIALSVIPIFTQAPYFMHLMVLAMIYGIVASNWNLAIGYGGIFHLAQVPFFAVGGYASGVLAFQLGVSPWIGLLTGGIAAVFLSIIIGVPSLRVRGIYLIFLTFAFHFILHSLAMYFIDITGGAIGLILPPYQIGSVMINMFNAIPSYYMALLLLISSLILIKKVVDSNIGLALISLRDSEEYAVSRGVNPYKYKLSIFIISSFMTGVSGAFYVHYLRVVTPSILEFTLLIIFLAAVVVGGAGTIYGPLIGAFTLTFLGEVLRITDLYRNVIFGILIAVILIYMPRGLITIIDRLQATFFPAIKSGKNASVTVVREDGQLE